MGNTNSGGVPPRNISSGMIPTEVFASRENKPKTSDKSIQLEDTSKQSGVVFSNLDNNEPSWIRRPKDVVSGNYPNYQNDEPSWARQWNDKPATPRTGAVLAE